MRYHQALLMIPEGVDITDDSALLSQFNALVQGMTGQENQALAAVFAQGFKDLIGELVAAFSATQGYAAVGTRPYGGKYLVHISTTWTGPSLDLLCALYQGAGQDWSLVAHQPYDEQPTGETTVDDEGNEVAVRAVVPYRAIPQSILPWMQPAVDDEGNETPAVVVDGKLIGTFMGAAPWVVATE